jgi:hypothetical protein
MIHPRCRGAVAIFTLLGTLACAPPRPSGVWDVQRTPQQLGSCAQATPWMLNPDPDWLMFGVRLDPLSSIPCALAIDGAFVDIGSQVVAVQRLPPPMRLNPSSSVYIRLTFPDAGNRKDQHDSLRIDFRVDGAPATLTWPVGAMAN